MTRKVIATLALLLVLAPLAAVATDADLLRAKVREGIVSTYTAVSNESAATTNHAERQTVMTNARDNIEVWSERIVRFILDNAPANADTCTGDGEAGPLTCSPGGTQAAVDSQISGWLSTEVNAIVGAP